MKICSKCKVDYSYTTSSWCKSCRREAAKIKRLENGQIPKIIYNDLPGFKVCRHCEISQTLDNFSTASPEHSAQGVSSYCKNCNRVLYPPNREKGRLATASYRRNNRERYLLSHRVAQAKRRGLTVNGCVSTEDAKSIYAKEFCRYCKLFTPMDLRTADHIVSLNKGGRHDISNLDMACWSCNCSKKDKTEEEFITFMRKNDKCKDNC